MRESEQPLSGTQLGKVTGVSRQVVVQDIALLRTEGYPIVSTAKGYLLNEPKCATRVLKVAIPMNRLRRNSRRSLIWAVPS